MDSKLMEIRLEDLIPFKCHSGKTYEGERLQQMMDSIKSTGLLYPIIVRPIDNEKYEIICGHNRVKAVSSLGYDTIRADVRYGLSDEEALALFYDSNLNQQSFSDWSYLQKFDAVKYIDTLIRQFSRQGERNDLKKEGTVETADTTCVQTRHKLPENSRRVTIRDKMSRRLGISTATLSKYRRIIKLPDNILKSIIHLLDEKRITFEAAYIISNLQNDHIIWLIKELEQYPDKILDLKRLRKLPQRNEERPGVILPLSKRQVLDVLAPRSADHTGMITPVRRGRR